MSKVICDVCGTTYPETASVCPICGCAKNTTAQTAADSSEQGEGTSYTYVKGGRFSKSNVRKRNRKSKETGRADGQEPHNDGTNKGLVAVVLILLLAIIAVLVYIGVRFLLPNEEPNTSTPGFSDQTGNTEPSDTGETTVPEDLSCTQIKLSANNIELTAVGNVWMLSTELQPVDTTDPVTFESADPSVATVDENGKITAVGGGETMVTVKCGEITAQCKVVCTFGDPKPTTDPTEPPVVVPDNYKLELRYSDITISERYPDPVSLYKRNDAVKAADITWTVDDPKVATVDENGVVSPVGKGNTVVRAAIGGQTASCKIIVAFSPAEQPQAKYKISHTDVTLTIGGDDSFRLSLTTQEGANVDVSWTVNEEGYIDIDGKNIKGIKATKELDNRYVTVSATVEDYTYSCIVRVVEKKEAE